MVALSFSVYIAVNIFIFCECGRMNLAVNKLATQISQYENREAGRANDGIDGTTYNGDSCSHTEGYGASPPETHPWWEVDLLQDYYIPAVAISYPKKGPPQLLHDFSIMVYRSGEHVNDSVICYYHVGLATQGTTELYFCKSTIKGRHVRITINSIRAEMLVLCEVKVIGSEHATTASFTKFDDGDPDAPDMTYSVQGYGQCAMKCYVLPMCRIFSVKSMSTYYQCNIFNTENPKLIGNSTGNPGTVVYMI